MAFGKDTENYVTRLENDADLKLAQVRDAKEELEKFWESFSFFKKLGRRKVFEDIIARLNKTLNDIKNLKKILRSTCHSAGSDKGAMSFARQTRMVMQEDTTEALMISKFFIELYE